VGVVVVVVVSVVVVVVDVVVVVVVVVETISTVIVLKISKGLSPVPPTPSFKSPSPTTAAVAIPGAIAGIVQGNGPAPPGMSLAGRSTMVTMFAHSGGGGRAPAPVRAG